MLNGLRMYAIHVYYKLRKLYLKYFIIFCNLIHSVWIDCHIYLPCSIFKGPPPPPPSVGLPMPPHVPPPPIITGPPPPRPGLYLIDNY
jgi:hypothetical protein